jgi:hypothetical protein
MRPCWAHQRLLAIGTLVGDSIDTMKMHFQFQAVPHAFITTAIGPKKFQEVCGILEYWGTKNTTNKAIWLLHILLEGLFFPLGFSLSSFLRGFIL